MKTIVVTLKNESEYKFITELLNRLGILSTTMSKEDLEDFGLSQLLQSADTTKKVGRKRILKKLRS